MLIFEYDQDGWSLVDDSLFLGQEGLKVSNFEEVLTYLFSRGNKRRNEPLVIVEPIETLEDNYMMVLVEETSSLC